MGLLYLDSSALVKLVLPEPETDALLGLLTAWPERISSALARVEVLRTVRRAGDEEAYRRAQEVLARVGLLRIDDAVLGAAALLRPPELRTLDAIHLASALSVGERLGGMVVYDFRLARAAEVCGVHVMAPEAPTETQ